MAKETELPVKALAKLGKALAALPDAIDFIEAKENLLAKLDTEVAARQKVLADLAGDAVKASEAVESAKADGKKAIDAAKVRAREIAIKTDLDAQEAAKKAADVLTAAQSALSAVEAAIAERKLEEAALAEKVATLTKAEADILARIAAHKAKLIAALEG